MNRCGRSCLAVGMLLAVSQLGLAAGGEGMEKNYWRVFGDKLSFAGADLTIGAELPHGFTSLRVAGHEFLAGGEGYGGITYRKKDGSFVTRFTDISNLSHDQMHGRNGYVADGLYLVKFRTGWTLPEFSVYAGFNDPDEHELILFLHDDVLAARLVTPGTAVSVSRKICRPGGGELSGKSMVLVHKSGTALRVNHAVRVETVAAPDGKQRFAVVIPCKGMAPNDIAFRYDVHSGTDNLLVFPELTVDSPAIKNAPFYKPQSNGYWALYGKDEPVTYAVAFGWLGRDAFRGRAVVEARHALGRPHVRAEAGPQQTGKQDGMTQYAATIRPAFSMPGVSEVNVHLLDANDVVLYTQRVRIMYDWPSYKPRYNAPPDLEQFWRGTLTELAEIPLDAKVEARLFADDPTCEFYHVSFAGLGGERVHACLYVPREGERPLPARVTAHPGSRGFGVNHAPDGVYGSELKIDLRFVTIQPLIRGHAPDADGIPFNQPWWGPLDSRDEYAARSWYCAMVRAIDYLASRPDIADMSRLIVTGGSQGGALAIATAALDGRVKLCLSDSPSNSMHHDAVRPDTYQTFGPTSGQTPEGQTLDAMLKTLSYFDPAHLAPRITCPTAIGLNVGDLTVHSMGGLGIYKNLTSLPDDKKWFLPGVNGVFHSNSGAGGAKFRELTEKLLAGEL